MVHFVGAGPGACDLITVRGMNRIKEADVIIYAGSLVNPELLSYAKADCRIYNSAHMTLDAVVAVMRAAEAEGKTTVRLHTGDPSVYGAIREQMDLLDADGIAYDVCPGVSAVFGAAASLACEYTLPDVTQTLILTRAEGKTPVPEKENLRSLAAHRASLVLYLSSGLAGKVRQELLLGGYAEDTPVAVVYKATWPEEKIVRTTLGALPESMEEAGISKTALIIVSPALGGSYEKSRLYDAAFATEYRRATEILLPAGIRRILLITCSVRGYATMRRLAEQLTKIPDAEIITRVKCEALPEISMQETVKTCVDMYFDKVDAIVFVTASGIAVRSVAAHLEHKSKDPAIVCMDELGKHVISLVSGHAGGANALTQMLADIMWATPVITTATDVESAFAIDDYAREHNLVVTDWTKAKKISAQVLEQGVRPEKPVSASETSEHAGISDADQVFDIGDYRIHITPGQMEIGDMELQLVPRCIVAGIGCKKGTTVTQIEQAVQAAFAKAGLRAESLCAVASIDLKKEERGLQEFCAEKKLPFVTYTAEQLREVPGDFSASEFVSGVTGVDNVCERSAAKYAADCMEIHDQLQKAPNREYAKPDARLLLRKQAEAGVTVALALAETVCTDERKRG